MADCGTQYTDCTNKKEHIESLIKRLIMVDDDGNLSLSICGCCTVFDFITLTPSAESPADPQEGMIYADTDHHLYYYNGTSWVQLDNAQAQ